MGVKTVINKMVNRYKDFERIVIENKRRIYTVCYMFSKDKDEVADLFQEVLINIWKGLKNFQGDRYLSTWIWRVSYNTCIDAMRRSNREVNKEPLDVGVNLYDDEDADALQIKELHNRITQLGYVDRCLVLLWLENMSYDDIGSILGISANNVGVKLNRIKDKLKRG